MIVKLLSKSVFYICILILHLQANAQTCTGIYKVLATDDFGVGTSNYGPPLPVGTTTYVYNDGTLIEQCGAIQLPRPTYDGMYSRCNNPYNAWQICNVNTIVAPWVNTTDHTGNNGYMLICNAAGSPDIFYQKTYDVCAGTNCSFSIWATNICRLTNSCIIPIVQIDMVNPNTNQVLATTNSGNTLTSAFETQLNWKRLNLDFTVPVGLTQIKMVVRNLQFGNLGNDLALDDVAFSLCVPNSTINSAGFCLGSPATMQVSLQSGIFITPEYQWQVSTNNGASFSDIPNASSSSYTTPPINATSALYSYRVRYAGSGSLNNGNCNNVTAPYLIPAAPIGTPAALSANSPVCEGSDLSLECSNCSGNNFSWLGPNGFTSSDVNPIISSVSASNAGEYSVLSTTGCIATSSVQVLVNSKPTAVLSSNFPCFGKTLQLTVSSGQNVSYKWSGPIPINDTTSNIAILGFNENMLGIYKVTVTQNNCSSSFTVDVKPATGNPVYLPNSFTPNNDNLNDEYRVKTVQPNSFIRLALYNRYGQKIFETEDSNKGWDGTFKRTIADAGTYVWILYSIDCNGKKQMTKGSFLLIR